MIFIVFNCFKCVFCVVWVILSCFLDKSISELFYKKCLKQIRDPSRTTRRQILVVAAPGIIGLKLGMSSYGTSKLRIEFWSDSLLFILREEERP